MGGSKRVARRLARTDTTRANLKYGAGLLAVVGFFLVLSGGATAMFSLLASVSGDQAIATSGSDVLSTLHVIGLLAGLVGFVLLLVGLPTWLYLLMSGARHAPES